MHYTWTSYCSCFLSVDHSQGRLKVENLPGSFAVDEHKARAKDCLYRVSVTYFVIHTSLKTRFILNNTIYIFRKTLLLLNMTIRFINAPYK